MHDPATAPTVADHVSTTPEPPIPSDTWELERWNHTRLRRRMLYGLWAPDLRKRMNQVLPRARVQAWRLADISANVFRSSIQQVSVAYTRPPRITHDDPAAAEVLTAATRRAGLWSLQQRFQRDTIGMREMIQSADVLADAVPTYRPVYPDFVLADADPEQPDRMIRMREAQLRRTSAGQVWTWEAWDVSDPDAPRVQVLNEHGHDVSPEYLVDREGRPAPADGLTGDLYDWRYSDGRPFIPRVLYHASRTGQLWDPFEGIEIVEGTLNVALMWSFFAHVVRNASWKQRYGMNVRIAGGITGTGDGRRDHVETDPAAIAMFDSDPEAPPGAQSVLSSFDVTPPHELAEAIALYERRLAAFAGVSPADVQRVAGDPRSGFALAISREGQREAQRMWEPQFRAGDEELLAMTAALINRATGSTLPESGYRLQYASIPLSAEERKAEREHLLELVEAGLLDRVSAYMQMHPGLTEADAAAQLERIRYINAQYS